MKIVLVVLSLYGLVAGAFAQANEWSGAWQGGGGTNETVNDVITGVFGLFNVSKYVVGSYVYSTSFGPNSLTAIGGTDVFIARLNTDGGWAWARTAGGGMDDAALSVASDGLGNMYVCGYFVGTAIFGGTTLIGHNSSYPDIFVAKLDLDGNWLWAVSAGSTWEDYANGVSCDNAGNCYVTGSYCAVTNSATFGGINLPSSDYGDDIFVAKLSPSGTWLWASRAGSEQALWNDHRAYAIHTDYSTGESYVTGSAEGPTQFGNHGWSPGGDMDAFVATIDSNGIWTWCAPTGGGGSTGRGIAADLVGNIYVTGYFSGSLWLRPDLILYSSGPYDSDAFIAKVTDGVGWQWGRRAGGTGPDEGQAIALGDAVYCSGFFHETGYFGGTGLPSAGDSDIYAAKLDSAGNWLCARRAGGSGPDEGKGISRSIVFGNTMITVAGSFFGQAEFEPWWLSSNGGTDAFVAAPIFVNVPYGPAQPQNLNVQVNLWGNDIVLDWDLVTVDTNGDERAADYYAVYYATAPEGPFYSVGTTFVNTLTFFNWAIDYSPRFFMVKAGYW